MELRLDEDGLDVLDKLDGLDEDVLELDELDVELRELGDELLVDDRLDGLLLDGLETELVEILDGLEDELLSSSAADLKLAMRTPAVSDVVHDHEGFTDPAVV